MKGHLEIRRILHIRQTIINLIQYLLIGVKNEILDIVEQYMFNNLSKKFTLYPVTTVDVQFPANGNGDVDVDGKVNVEVLKDEQQTMEV